MVMKGYSTITGASPSNCSVSYPGQCCFCFFLVGGLTFLQRCSRCIILPQLIWLAKIVFSIGFLQKSKKYITLPKKKKKLMSVNYHHKNSIFFFFFFDNWNLTFCCYHCVSIDLFYGLLQVNKLWEKEEISFNLPTWWRQKMTSDISLVSVHSRNVRYTDDTLHHHPSQAGDSNLYEGCPPLTNSFLAPFRKSHHAEMHTSLTYAVNWQHAVGLSPLDFLTRKWCSWLSIWTSSLTNLCPSLQIWFT